MNLIELEQEVLRLRATLSILVASYNSKVDPDILKKIQEGTKPT